MARLVVKPPRLAVNRPGRKYDLPLGVSWNKHIMRYIAQADKHDIHYYGGTFTTIKAALTAARKLRRSLGLPAPRLEPWSTRNAPQPAA